MDEPTEDDWNQLRCFMHEAIIKLMDANRKAELSLLKTHIDAAIEQVEQLKGEPC